jgi:hypothetical protein
MAKILNRDVKAIVEALDAGLILETYDRRGNVARRFRKGDITLASCIEDGYLATSHLSANLDARMGISAQTVESLARQAKRKLAEKDELLAQQAASIASFLDR